MPKLMHPGGVRSQMQIVVHPFHPDANPVQMRMIELTLGTNSTGMPAVLFAARGKDLATGPGGVSHASSLQASIVLEKRMSSGCER